MSKTSKGVRLLGTFGNQPMIQHLGVVPARPIAPRPAGAHYWVNPNGETAKKEATS